MRRWFWIGDSFFIFLVPISRAIAPSVFSCHSMTKVCSLKASMGQNCLNFTQEIVNAGVQLKCNLVDRHWSLGERSGCDWRTQNADMPSFASAGHYGGGLSWRVEIIFQYLQILNLIVMKYVAWDNFPVHCTSNQWWKQATGFYQKVKWCKTRKRRDKDDVSFSWGSSRQPGHWLCCGPRALRILWTIWQQAEARRSARLGIEYFSILTNSTNFRWTPATIVLWTLLCKLWPPVPACKVGWRRLAPREMLAQWEEACWSCWDSWTIFLLHPPLLDPFLQHSSSLLSEPMDGGSTLKNRTRMRCYTWWWQPSRRSWSSGKQMQNLVMQASSTSPTLGLRMMTMTVTTWRRPHLQEVPFHLAGLPGESRCLQLLRWRSPRGIRGREGERFLFLGIPLREEKEDSPGVDDRY